MLAWLRSKLNIVSVMVVGKCLSTLYFPLSSPRALPISAAPRRVDTLGDPGEFSLGRLERVLAFTGAFVGPARGCGR